MLGILTALVVVLLIGIMAALIIVVSLIRQMDGLHPEDIMRLLTIPRRQAPPTPPPVPPPARSPSRQPDGRQVLRTLPRGRFTQKTPVLARLLIESGYSRGQWVTVSSLPFVMGRNHRCDLQIVDPTVSRFHAHLARRGDTWFVQDTQSANGTWVNGAIIDRSWLLPGDKITLGSTTLIFYDEQPG